MHSTATQEAAEFHGAQSIRGASMPYGAGLPSHEALPMTESRAILCPYCGDRQQPSQQCRTCGGLFDQWSVHATQNDMGAWYVRDAKRPHFVGFSYEALIAAIRAGDVGRDAIVRGPTTNQFWSLARRTLGIAHLFNRCHSCQAPIQHGLGEESDEVSAQSTRASTPTPAAALTPCTACGASLEVVVDRNFFGLARIERIAIATDATADLSAFVLDSGLLVLAPRGKPESSSAIVASTAAVEPRPLVSTAPPSPSTAPSTAPMEARSAISAIDRTLASRARHLERVNRMLMVSTVCAVAFMLLFGFAYFLLRDQHERELTEARARGAEDVRAEFAKSAPVVTPPATVLPTLPEATPAVEGPKLPRSGA